jgi:hypothetical protein
VPVDAAEEVQWCSRAAAEWDQGFLVLDEFPLNFGVVSNGI